MRIETSNPLSTDTIKLIQRELRQVYEEKKATTKYSCPMMAKEIQDFWRYELPDEFREAIPYPYRNQTELGLYVEGTKRDNFRKFVMGESKSMQPLRNYAALMWLCSTDVEESKLSASDLSVEQLPGQRRFIATLDTHLYQHASNEPALRPEHFRYSYELSSHPSDCCICFSATQNPHVLAMEMFEIHRGSEESQLVAYEGYVVIRADDTGFALLQSRFNGDSRMYCFIPNGVEIFKEGVLQRFSLIEIGGETIVFTDELDLPVLSFRKSSDVNITEDF